LRKAAVKNEPWRPAVPFALPRKRPQLAAEFGCSRQIKNAVTMTTKTLNPAFKNFLVLLKISQVPWFDLAGFRRD
jgi:hypothetical protein